MAKVVCDSKQLRRRRSTLVLMHELVGLLFFLRRKCVYLAICDVIFCVEELSMCVFVV